VKTRTAIIMAMLVMLGLSSGAMAGEVRKVAIELPAAVDTSLYLTSGTALVDDTLGPFSSASFGLTTDWTELVARIFQTSPDSIFAKDSFFIALDTKADDIYDSVWNRLAVTPLTAVADMGAGESIFLSIDADSTLHQGDLFRYQFYWIVDIDSIRAHGAAGILAPNMAFRAHTMPRLR